VQEIRGISLVFREMWDSTALPRHLSTVFVNSEEIERVPHVRQSVRGAKKMGEAQQIALTESPTNPADSP
jgi:hypothetical protein